MSVRKIVGLFILFSTFRNAQRTTIIISFPNTHRVHGFLLSFYITPSPLFYSIGCSDLAAYCDLEACLSPSGFSMACRCLYDIMRLVVTFKILYDLEICYDLKACYYLEACMLSSDLLAVLMFVYGLEMLPMILIFPLGP